MHGFTGLPEQLTALGSLEKAMLTKKRNVKAVQVQTAQQNTFQSEVTIQQLCRNKAVGMKSHKLCLHHCMWREEKKKRCVME